MNDKIFVCVYFKMFFWDFKHFSSNVENSIRLQTKITEKCGIISDKGEQE